MLVMRTIVFVLNIVKVQVCWLYTHREKSPKKPRTFLSLSLEIDKDKALKFCDFL